MEYSKRDGQILHVCFPLCSTSTNFACKNCWDLLRDYTYPIRLINEKDTGNEYMYEDRLAYYCTLCVTQKKLKACRSSRQENVERFIIIILFTFDFLLFVQVLKRKVYENGINWLISIEEGYFILKLVLSPFKH